VITGITVQKQQKLTVGKVNSADGGLRQSDMLLLRFYRLQICNRSQRRNRWSIKSNLPKFITF